MQPSSTLQVCLIDTGRRGCLGVILKGPLPRMNISRNAKCEVIISLNMYKRWCLFLKSTRISFFGAFVCWSKKVHHTFNMSSILNIIGYRKFYEDTLTTWKIDFDHERSKAIGIFRKYCH